MQAISTGHAGLGTIHGDSALGVIRRMESKPMDTPRALIANLSMIATQRRVRLGTKQVRRTVEIMEVVGMDAATNDLVTNRKFSWDPRDDVFIDYGRSYILEHIADLMGYTEAYVKEELDRRGTILRALVKTKRRTFKDVAEAVQAYYADRDAAYDHYKKMLENVKI
jgi:flagellar protein FlaI